MEFVNLPEEILPFASDVTFAVGLVSFSVDLLIRATTFPSMSGIVDLVCILLLDLSAISIGPLFIAIVK